MSIEVVTTSFSHRTKQMRNISEEQVKSVDYKLTMIDEPGYRKNVTLQRFYSHYILGRNLKKYLKKRKKPDVIYCSVPSLDVARVAAKYAEEHNIRFIIDVQDLWPEAFSMVFNIPIISDMLFWPMVKQADYIYTQADEIIAVSQTYANRALKVNTKCQEAHSVFLGTDLTTFDTLVEENAVEDKPSGEIWLTYIGTLGHSYDIINVLDALKILQDKGIKNIKFIIIGDGPLQEKFEKYAKEKDVYVKFTGRLAYSKMVGILNSSDIAVNPIKAGSAGSIINKVGDYAAAGLPVINTQECQEYKDLIEEYQIGFHCENNKPVKLSKRLLELSENENLRRTMGEKNRRLAEEKFDRSKTYKEIIKLIEDPVC